MAQQISIPGTGDPVLLPSNQNFYFRLATPCTVCFGPSNPPGAFPDLSNQTFSNWGAQSPDYPIPANATAYIQFNTSALGTPCSLAGIAAAPRIIHVGSGIQGNVGGPSGPDVMPGKKKKKDKDKKKAKGKHGDKKHPGKHKAKKSAKKAGKKGSKKSPKKAAKKAAKKATKKSAKKAAKSRSAGKGRRR